MKNSTLHSHYLLNKAITDSGLASKNIHIDDDLITDIIVNYTRESGVRQLERVIRKLCSKAARILVEEQSIPLLLQIILNTILARIALLKKK